MIVRAFLLVLVFAALFAVVVWGISKKDKAKATRLTLAAVASFLFGLAARIFGVSSVTVDMLISGKTWRHV